MYCIQMLDSILALACSASVLGKCSDCSYTFTACLIYAAVLCRQPAAVLYIAEASKPAGIGYLRSIKRQRFLSAASPISYHKTKSFQVLSSRPLLSILNTSKTKGCVATVKYMHFNASCSYCALAEMLADLAIQTEDVQIAQEINLPWLFSKEGDTYLSGPMLQGKRWFDLWLNPRGLAFSESVVSSEPLHRLFSSHSLRSCLGCRRLAASTRSCSGVMMEAIISSTPPTGTAASPRS